jgi:sulfopyruvate decarboxylase TPP-binding subunit
MRFHHLCVTRPSTCIVIAGPNGAGKTTFAREFLPKDTRVVRFVYLPDSANYFIQRLAAADPQVTSVSITREDEGLAIAMGAFMGGRNPVLIIEASGLGLCTLALAVLGHEQRMASLILYGHNFALGEVRDVHACTRWVAEPVLDALHADGREGCSFAD